jgi:predicted N-acetyltransferase YhbS
MIVRPETPSDYEAIGELLTSAFGGEDESQLVLSELRARG